MIMDTPMALMHSSWSTTWADHSGPSWTLNAPCPGKPGLPEPSKFRGNHDLRLQVFAAPKPVTAKPATFYIDSYKSSNSPRTLSVICAHTASGGALTPALKRFLELVATTDRPEESIVAAYEKDGGWIDVDPFKAGAMPAKLSRIAPLQRLTAESSRFELYIEDERDDDTPPVVILSWSPDARDDNTGILEFVVSCKPILPGEFKPSEVKRALLPYLDYVAAQ